MSEGRSFAEVFGEIGSVWDALVGALKVQTGEICGLKQRAVCELAARTDMETRLAAVSERASADSQRFQSMCSEMSEVRHTARAAFSLANSMRLLWGHMERKAYGEASADELAHKISEGEQRFAVDFMEADARAVEIRGFGDDGMPKPWPDVLDAVKNLEKRVTRIEEGYHPSLASDETEGPVVEDADMPEGVDDAPTPEDDVVLTPLEYTLTFKLKPDELAALATLHETDADIIMASGGVEAFMMKVYNRQAATLLVEMGKTARAVIAKAAQSQFPYRDDGQ